MKKISVLITFFLLALPSFALEVVYPKRQAVTVNANSTFFIGNVEEGAELFINDLPVKVYKGGVFTEVVKLTCGANKFSIKSLKNGVEERLEYVVNVPISAIGTRSQAAEFVKFPDDSLFSAEVVKDFSPLRDTPSSEGKRLSHLDKGVDLMLDGQKGDFYRVKLSDKDSAWVHKDALKLKEQLNEFSFAGLKGVDSTENEGFYYTKIMLSKNMPYVLSKTDKGLNLKIFGIKNLPPNNTFNLDIEKPADYGYDSFYEENTLVIKSAKQPVIDSEKPLKGIKIFIDPGHGGSEKGAIGCGGIPEKDINLAISKYLHKELEKAGAKVIMSRSTDIDLGLYNRVKLARESEALISLSIHANALPDGADPFLKRGTSAFYYNKDAKPLADTIKNSLTKQLGTKDDGTSYASFVMTRMTLPLSILVEVAYIIHPEEYSLLTDDEFKKQAAKAIKNGLEDYLKNKAAQSVVF